MLILLFLQSTLELAYIAMMLITISNMWLWTLDHLNLNQTISAVLFINPATGMIEVLHVIYLYSMVLCQLPINVNQSMAWTCQWLCSCMGLNRMQLFKLFNILFVHGLQNLKPFKHPIRVATWKPLNNKPEGFKQPIHACTQTISSYKTIKSKQNLRSLNFNFQSIKTKQPQLEYLIDGTNPDIISGTDTWMDYNIKDYHIFPKRFNIFRNDRNLSGRGVLIPVKNIYITTSVQFANWLRNCMVLIGACLVLN